MTALRIAPFAPSSPPDPQRLREGLEIIKKEGPEIIWVPHPPVVTASAQGPFDYLADSDESQVKSFKRIIQDDSLDFIWTMRGGYGSSRWADKVQLEKAETSHPVIIGFSDVTFLHSAILRRGLYSIHAPLITTISKTNRDSRDALWSCLTHGKFPALHGHSITTGKASGRLVGGNLTCVVHSLGTSYEPPWDMGILFIEDHNEAPYRIDRILTQLLHSGRLSRLAGIVAGGLTTSNPSHFDLGGLLKDRLSGLNIPVIMDIPAGHGPDNYPLLLGGIYELDADGGKLMPLTELSRAVKT